MYERPTLLEIGGAMNMIQGSFGSGDDLDGHQVGTDFEFGEDSSVIPEERG